jgi:AraC-like DNA-binding protein
MFFGGEPTGYALNITTEETHGELGMAKVAFRFGFANQSHFCLHFRRIVGVTPRQFRGSARTPSLG